MPISLTVDPEFEALLDKQSPAELEELEQQLLRDGCQDTIKLWKGTNTILDGMSRYRLCLKHKIAFETANVLVANRGQALEWIIRNQLGRRNVSPECRQRLVLALRKEGKSTREIAQVVHVSQPTVVRDLQAASDSYESLPAANGQAAKPPRPPKAAKAAGAAQEASRAAFDEKGMERALRAVARCLEGMRVAYGKSKLLEGCVRASEELEKQLRHYADEVRFEQPGLGLERT